MWRGEGDWVGTARRRSVRAGVGLGETGESTKSGASAGQELCGFLALFVFSSGPSESSCDHALLTVSGWTLS